MFTGSLTVSVKTIEAKLAEISARESDRRASDSNVEKAFEIKQLLDQVGHELNRTWATYESGDTRGAAASLSLTLIELKDILILLDKIGHRVNLKGALIQTWPKNGDLTDLICKIRGVVGHLFSEGNKVDEGIKSRWIWLDPCTSVTIGRKIVNQTSNDVMVAFGNYELYLMNNVLLAIAAAYDKCVRICLPPTELYPEVRAQQGPN